VLAERIREAGHLLAVRDIVADERDAIRAVVQTWIADPAIDVILTTGGTGFTGRDITPEALEPLFEKRMDGFSEVFHRISYDKIGTSTIQSRATGGVANATFIFALPGSPGACRDAWDGILKFQLDYRHMPCNFVEIMPRLDEHLRRGPARVNRLSCGFAPQEPALKASVDQRHAARPLSRNQSWLTISAKSSSPV
jgi:molybdenum cofactor biosynthesis protein B